jgi:lipopolysaccharide transport protein LptA/LPS export ABC transporter protein LptC
MTTEGTLAYQVQIDHGIEYSNRLIDFTGGHFLAYQDPGTPPWRGRATSGSYNRILQQLELKDDVVLGREGFSTMPPMVFKTQALSVNLKTQMAQTSVGVQFEEPGSPNQATAVGMQLNYLTHQLKLFSHVKSLAEPLLLSDALTSKTRNSSDTTEGVDRPLAGAQDVPGTPEKSGASTQSKFSQSAFDNQQLLHVDSDQAEIDYAVGIAKYLGHVHATQGSRDLQGNQLILFQNMKTHALDKVQVMGSPATYHFLPGPGEQTVFARGDDMVFLPQQNLLIVTGNAHVKQGANMFNGPEITYNTLTSKIHAPMTTGQRPSMVIEPIDEFKSHASSTSQKRSAS